MKIVLKFLCTVIVVLQAANVTAQEVNIKHNGLTLNAKLELAAGKKITDGVILITHGGLAHRDMEFVTYLQELLVKEKGYNALAINLSLGVDNRHGMYDCQTTHRHRNQDAADEIGAWVEWLGQQGVSRVTLLGHSRGGAQTALYVAERDTPRIKAVVLMAPATASNTSAEVFRESSGKPLAPSLERAQGLVKAGQGDTVLEHVAVLNCQDSKATAASFVSYYGPEARVDTPTLLARIHKPTLVLVAGEDEVVVDLGPRLASMARTRTVQVHTVKGAGHLFRDLYSDEAVEVIDGFLKTTGFQQE